MKQELFIIKVGKNTRAGKLGKEIICPLCNYKTLVYHFSWAAIKCNHCNNMINKEYWIELYSLITD
jgi:ribosomal protein S27E